MREIVTEDTIIMNPTDALKMEIQNGDSIFVKSDIYEKIYPVIVRKIISQNFLLLITSSRTFDFNPNPCSVHIRRNNV
jgi:anaerobic selenocysteine-containing dehydrogenase